MEEVRCRCIILYWFGVSYEDRSEARLLWELIGARVQEATYACLQWVTCLSAESGICASAAGDICAYAVRRRHSTLVSVALVPAGASLEMYEQ